jgi:hypothetical protein
MRKGQRMPEEVKRRISLSEKGKHVSNETREKMRKVMTGQKGEKCRNWAGDDVGYCGIHDWLALQYGKANMCENSWCLGTSNKFQWAKLEEKRYERRRENFIQLCTRCHVRYDKGYPIKIHD